MSSKYAALLRQVYSMRPKKNVDLSRIAAAASQLGDPQLTLKYIHVTGTNGKGSVCWKLATALEEAGFKVGLFTSPHIASFRERFRVNGRIIDEPSVVWHLERVLGMFKANDWLGTMSFFDLAVLVAFLYFQEQSVDVVVMEVGIGGRLDPTNIIPPSYLAVLVSVDLEHTEYLGNTREAIAWDKCHIIKDQVPAVVGPNVPLSVVEDRVRVTNSPLYIVPPLEQADDFDLENQAVTGLCIEALRRHHPIFGKLTASSSALARLPPCRCEVWLAERLRELGSWPKLPAAVVFDVAHNPAGVQHLFLRMRRIFPDKQLVGLVASSADKDVNAVSHVYVEACRALYVLPVTHMRLLAGPELLTRLASAAEGTSCIVNAWSGVAGDEQAQLRALLASVFDTATPNDVVVVTGSFFIMHSVRTALGIDEPCDPDL